MMSAKKRLRLSVSLKSQPSLLVLAEEKIKKINEAESQSQEKTKTWCHLPLELMVQVCSYLNPKDKRNLFQVCSHWSAAANVSLLWKHSWVSLKNSLISRPEKFWDLVKIRSFDRIHLHHNFNHFVNDIKSLYDNVPHLKGLHLEFSSKLDPKCFTHLLHFKYLTILKLDFKKRYTSTSEISQLKLKELPQLRSMSLIGISDFSRFDVSFLSHPFLKFLSLESCGSFREGDTNTIISYFPNLCRLEIKACVYYNSFIACDETINASKQLAHIDLSRSLFNGEVCIFPKWFLFLQSLDLSFCKQSHIMLCQIFSQLTNLKDLNLRGNFCTNETFHSLSCPELVSINLCMNYDITSLSNLGAAVGKCLKILNLCHCVGLVMTKINTFHVISLLFPNIQSLHLCGWNLSSKELITLLLLCKTLKKVYIDRCINQKMYSEIYTATNTKTLLLACD